MKTRIARSLAAVITGRPFIVLTVIAVLVALSGWRASKLTINSNQLDMLPAELPSVQATHEMTKMVGGVGFLMLALRGTEEEHLKSVADDLAAKFEAMDSIRRVTYKQDVKFVRERIGLLADTADVKEGYKRIRKKVKAVLAKNNPFHIELVETKDEPLVLDDLIEKYTKLNKKSITDPYYIDDAKEMLLILLKPMGEASDLDYTQKVIAEIDGFIADYNDDNQHGAKLAQGYQGMVDGSTITYGYTGSYKTNVDDSYSIRKALGPTSIVAFVGILLYVLIFLRRITQTVFLMATLVAATIITFAFCELAVGELNTITTILGAILMGLGIDFGIHLLYRLREEYTRTEDLNEAIALALEHSGSASAASALTTASALYVLIFAHITGFSDFGLVMGTGVLIQAAMMYIAIPAIYVAIARVRPTFSDSLLVKKQVEGSTAALADKRFPYAGAIVTVAALLTAGLTYFATKIDFDYDGRSLMATNNPALDLRFEIQQRFDISSDPVGVFTPTLEESKALFDTLTPPAEESMIESVVSINALVPPIEHQEANAKYLRKLAKLLEQIDPSMLDDPKLAENFDRAAPYLAAEPFTVDDVPPWILGQLRPVENSGYDGWLTFIYPKTSLWDGRELMQFADEVSAIEVEGTTYHAAGAAVLFAQVAQYVLQDGKNLTLIAALVILLIILVAFRKVSAAVYAMLPLVAGLIWMMGLMTLNDYRLNFMNVVVFPVVFGYGISAGIHVYSRYIESGSVMLAVRRTGAAVAVSSLTTLVGWGALLVSEHRGLISMGVLACLGIASALLVSLTLLPALLQVMHKEKATSPGSNPPGQETA